MDKGVARIFGRGIPIAFCSKATDSAIFCASEAARSATGEATHGSGGADPNPNCGFEGKALNWLVRGAKPPGKFAGCYVNFRPGEHL